MFDIRTDRHHPYTLSVVIDGLYEVQLNRCNEGIDVFVKTARNENRLASAHAFDDQILRAEN